jgi:protein-tyrosine phosphatase
VTTDEDLLRLASADNFRDVAGPGHPTRDGGRVRTGLVYRSNELQLTDVDAGHLERLGVTSVLDLREQHEVEAHPDVAVPGASWTHLPVGGIPPGTATELPDAAAAHAAMLEVYRRFVTDDRARASFGGLLRRVGLATTPLLFHCTAGKDRTGWASALLLHVAGVERDLVEADYLLTNERSRGTREKYLGLVAEHLGPDRVATFEPTMVADADYLAAAYRQAEESHGSLDGYLRDGLGLDAEGLRTLRDRLVG